jgi:hypothetical protein
MTILIPDQTMAGSGSGRLLDGRGTCRGIACTSHLSLDHGPGQWVSVDSSGVVVVASQPHVRRTLRALSRMPPALRRLWRVGNRLGEGTAVPGG